MPVLTLQLNAKNIARYEFKNKKQITIGRRPDNDIYIDNLSVSGQHAKIERLKNGYYVTDLDSTNGSLVNRKPIASQWLNDGDIITIGKYNLIFERQDDTVPEQIIDGIEPTMELDTGSFYAINEAETKTNS